EGWAWTHGEHTLGIFAFCQEHMLFSVVTPETTPASKVLLFGGACMLGGEPAALTRIAAGQTIELGFTRYQTVRGGFTEAAHAFRALLDERGCRFPADYNPPVHWEQLYDMSGAWNDRPNQYTRAVLEKEAAKGRAFSCEALYLDPGWDTDFGTFLWGEAWLGPQRDFARLIEAQYGLKLALHCPLATWMSHPVVSWGIGAVRSWPKAAARMAPPGGPELRVPAMRDGRRNLALAPSAKPATSSVYQDGALPIHQTAHLNDGWYGNTASWIAGRLPAWAEIDLGSEQRISRVVLSNDHLRQYSDRTITSLRVLVAMEYAADSAAPAWREVAQYRGEGFQSEEVLDFPPAEARWVRIDIPAGSAKTLEDVPRLDEIEVYEAAPAAEADARGFEQAARRGPAPATTAGSQICLASKQYLDEAERRLLACCAAGAIFLMFDGNGWNGGCLNPDHGHPVPYRMEDHARANLDLVQRIHAKYPRVLIELHDPIAGPNMARYVPVYYKYGLPGSFDENWAFELMWNPIDDLRAGRARSLYYYALGCNVPAYLHIDLRTDNAECIVLWWYASTCRHLGIGGTHPTPAVVEAQKQAMRLYRQWDRFFKRGEFHGLAEDVHFHVLPAENAFVVNVFNLSDEPATRTASIDLRKLGLDPQRTYAGSQDWGRVRDGRFELTITLPPWSARVARFGPADDTRKGG
ncbi:MAG: discoidin domain-containing protein, partial [Planctomycetota bacterium]